MNHSANIWYVRYLIFDPCEGVLWSQKGCEQQIENHRCRGTRMQGDCLSLAEGIGENMSEEDTPIHALFKFEARVFILDEIKKLLSGWRDGSIARNTYCSFRGHRFKSQQLHSGSHLPITQFSGTLRTPPDCQGYQACMWYRHTTWQNIYFI